MLDWNQLTINFYYILKVRLNVHAVSIIMIVSFLFQFNFVLYDYV